MPRAQKLLWIGILLSVLVGAGFLLAGGFRSFSGPYQDKGDISLQKSTERYEEDTEVNRKLAEDWRKYQLFTWEWWANLGLAVLPWLVWLRVRPRASTHRLLHMGFFLIILSALQDFIGVTNGLWRYHIEIFPSIPSYLPWDGTLYPVAGMLFFQYEPRLSRYLKALLFACMASLVVEPTFIWLRFYEPVKWSSFLSLPLHFVNYLAADWMGRRTEFKLLGPATWEPPGPQQ